MPPEVTIKPIVKYDIVINGQTFHDFKLESEWEGMAKYSGSAGTLIVFKTERSPIEQLFRSFSSSNPIGEPEEITCSVVKVSPSLAPILEPITKGEEQDKEEDSSFFECPYGYSLGKDCNEYSECAGCQKWDICLTKQQEED